jgi:hypothetical protein
LVNDRHTSLFGPVSGFPLVGLGSLAVQASIEVEITLQSNLGAIKMKLFYTILIAIVLVMQGFCEEPKQPQASADAAVFRQPFTLTLHIDKENYYEEKFPKIPYVHQNDVYLFKGDAFGIDLQITNGVIRKVSYQADAKKAAVSLRFTQEVKDGGDAMMLLVFKNQTGRKLFMDALMTVPGKESARKTSILPIGPGEVGYESWHHPIVQLVLRNIRLQEKPDAKQDKPAKGSQPIRSK